MVCVGIRPENIHLYNESMNPNEVSVLDARVSVVEALGSETIVYANLDMENEDGMDSLTEVRIKMLSNFDVKVGDIVKVAFDLTRIQLFDIDTEEAVIQRIPEKFSNDGTISNGVLTIFDSAVLLPPAIINQSHEGKVAVNVLTSAVHLNGPFEGTITKKEVVDQENLYWIKSGKDTVFLKTPLDVELKGKVTYDINLAEMKLTGKDYEIPRINLVTSLDCTAELVTKEKLVFRNDTMTFDVPFDIAQTLFNTKGKKLLKTNLQVIFNTNNEGENTFVAEVLDVKDYGNDKYAYVKYNNTMFYVKDKGYHVRDSVKVNLDLNQALIIDKDLNIILTGTEPKRL